ncbi:hypothetical protein GCM10007067_24560 [Lysobacter bugurensis]|uniref:Uncharacterized protein n=1 Tax=Cognatilysobacter bugurensis TaxID=543356 RepID=A0A918W9M4_9GAMM|nr:hypothetical protein GCM10007067_24560 [Lysobacter bugurensis]
MELACALALMATLGACSHEAAKPENSARADAAAAEAAIPSRSPVIVPPSPNPAVDHLQSNVVADKAAFQPEAATVEGDALTSTGKPGFVLFGPYATLAPGRYRLALNGHLDAPGVAGITVDVSSRGKAFAEAVVKDAEASGPLASLDFELARETPALEVRVRASEGARVRVESYTVTRAR